MEHRRCGSARVSSRRCVRKHDSACLDKVWQHRVWTVGVSVALIALFVLPVHAADRAYNVGYRNFKDVLKLIGNRFEDPEFDRHAILLSALDRVEWASEPEGSTPEIAIDREAFEALEPSELLQRIQRDIGDTLRNAETIFEATPPTAVDLWNAAATGLVEGLGDPYSQYLPPKNLEQLNDFLSGEPDPEKIFYGVGIHIDWDMVDNSGLLVIAPIPGGPAFTHDIRTGDIIVAVDGEPLETANLPVENLDKAVRRIKGLKGTQVSLTIRREGCHVPLERVLQRAPVNADMRLIKYMIDDDEGVGYLKLVNFYQNCAADVEEGLLWLISSGMKKLVLDFRYNPGGYLDQAVAVADLFMKRDSLLTYTRGRTQDERQDFIDNHTSRHGFETMDLVILLNQYSASASEVVTGALRDSGRCLVVGVKSFGKGSVQEVFPLQGDAALRLTVAKYYTPADRCIHGTGIEPDYEATLESLLPEATEGDLGEEGDREDEAAPTPTPPHYNSRLAQYLRNPQMKKAYEVLMGTVEGQDKAE